MKNKKIRKQNFKLEKNDLQISQIGADNIIVIIQCMIRRLPFEGLLRRTFIIKRPFLELLFDRGNQHCDDVKRYEDNQYRRR